MDLRQFALRIKAIANGVEVNAANVVRKVAVSIDSTVVMATPVDTGRARSNWIVELGAPSSVVRGAYSEGSEGSTEGANSRAAIEQGNATIAKYNGGSSIHITNNLPYIGKLNDGHSAQAPSGFVQSAVLDGAAQVKNARLIIKIGERVVRYDLGKIG